MLSSYVNIEYLYCGQAEEGDCEVPVFVVGDSSRVFAELNAQTPS